MTFSSKDACQYIAAQAAAFGGRAYYVGGCVRDSILGIQSKDTDVEIFGLSPEQIEKVLSKKFHFEAVGKSFGVWILKGLDIDVSMPRKERKNGLGHKSFEIIGDPNLSPKEACSRRDFTINAMLRDILSGEIIDPFDGQKDLAKKLIRHTSDKFAEDPLRVLRAMQFAARFDFDVAEKTVELCSNIPMENLPKERVFQEFKKLILKGKKISKGLAFLRDCNWVKYFPELSAMVGCPQDPIWHPEGDVYTHTMLCMDSFAQDRIGDEKEDTIVGLAVLCHDMGKPLCTKKDSTERIRSLGHDILGGPVAEKFLRRISDVKVLLDDVKVLVERHMAILDLWRSKAGDSAIRRLANKVGRIDRLVRIDKADREGRAVKEVENSPQGEWILSRAEELKIKDSAPKPLLMGRHLIERNLTPSPKFAEILNAAYEAQLDGKFFDIDGALKYLDNVLLK